MNCTLISFAEGIIASNADTPSRFKDLLMRSDYISRRIKSLILDTSSINSAVDLGNDNEIDHTGNPIDTFEDIMDAYSDIISLTGIFKLLYTSSNQPTWKHLYIYWIRLSYSFNLKLFLLIFEDSNDGLNKDEERMIVKNALSACKVYDQLLQWHVDTPKRNECKHLALVYNNRKPEEQMFRNIVKIKIIGAKRSNMWNLPKAIYQVPCLFRCNDMSFL